MTPRQRFITALEGGQVAGRVPHFELNFYPTMQAFGRIHPGHRNYAQWHQMEERERQLHRRDLADLHVQIAKRYEHSAIRLQNCGGWGRWYGDLENTELMNVITEIRNISGDEYCLLAHGDATLQLPTGGDMEELALRLLEEPEKMKAELSNDVDRAIARAEKFKKHGMLDGFTLCGDYCFNTNPFLSPAQFDEFVTPYLARLIKAYRDMGFYVIKHTDGNIMPILDSLLSTKPHALHSLDPQGGVDIAEVKRRAKGQVALIGNVNCGVMDTGTDEQVIESARYALQHGMPGGGYIFSTSNGIYTGMPLRRYELMLDVWRKEGNYPEVGGATKCACC